ncbi:CBS domain-containing protein [Spongiibacter taiwanensis]|uniref:CBS domain-containing protein n=1 Tax=Spongiibacter taiwanensis TaxID=1748242 RepID=UPI002034E391|nr:CBS domain-containing protein [Spongiibacter taiwanensis]USA41768.1 CBS domain-containing protein [Spongiibacter taiwanensis]
MNTNLLARDIMISPPPKIRSGTSLGEVVESLRKHRLGGIPVVDHHNKVVGFVSEQDCIHTMLVSSYHCEGMPTVDDVMHSEVLSVDPNRSIVDIAQEMGKNRPKSYPVIEDGVLVGLLTRGALLSALWENRAVCDSG